MNLFNEITAFIRLEILGSIIIYSILYFLLKIFFSRRKWLIETDKKAIDLLIDLSIFTYFTSVLVLIIKSWFNDETRMIIPIVLQCTFWYASVNLLRINFFIRFLLTRILIGLFVVLELGIITISIATWNSYMSWSEYKGLPKTWFENPNLNIEISEIILGILMKISLFIIITYGYSFLKNSILEKIKQPEIKAGNKELW